VQDTPANRLLLAPPGARVSSTDHFVPFQRSASTSFDPDTPPYDHPTAIQEVADVQDASYKTPPPGTLGVCWIVQEVPFHRSATVTDAPEGSV
jgi:hypothetical protein